MLLLKEVWGWGFEEVEIKFARMIQEFGMAYTLFCSII